MLLCADDRSALIAHYAATGHAAPPQLDGDGTGRLRSLYTMTVAHDQRQAMGGRRVCVLRACGELELRELVAVYLVRSEQPLLQPPAEANGTAVTEVATTHSIAAPSAADVLPPPFHSKHETAHQGGSPSGPAGASGTPAGGDLLCLVLRQDKERGKDRAGPPWPEALLHLRPVVDGAAGAPAEGTTAGALVRTWPWDEDSTADDERRRALHNASATIFRSVCHTVGCRSIGPTGSTSTSSPDISQLSSGAPTMRRDALGRYLCQECTAVAADSLPQRQNSRGHGQARTPKARAGAPSLQYCSLPAARRCADELVRAALGRAQARHEWEYSYLLNFGMGMGSMAALGQRDHAPVPGPSSPVGGGSPRHRATDMMSSNGRMPWVEWSPGLHSLVSGDAEVDMRALAVALRLRLTPACARLLESWLAMLPHPPADKRGWVSLSELALDWGSAQTQQQQAEVGQSDVQMAKLAAAASGQLAEYELAHEQAEAVVRAAALAQRQEQLGFGDEVTDMSIALMAADAVAERAAAEARYEAYCKATPTHTVEADAEAEGAHNGAQTPRAEAPVVACAALSADTATVSAADELARASGELSDLLVDADTSNDVYSSGFEDSFDGAAAGGEYSTDYLDDKSAEESEEEEDEHIRRLRDELDSLKRRRRQRQAEAEADAEAGVDAANASRSPPAAAAAATPQERQILHRQPPAVGGWVVPKSRLGRGEKY